MCDATIAVCSLSTTPQKDRLEANSNAARVAWWSDFDTKEIRSPRSFIRSSSQSSLFPNVYSCSPYTFVAAFVGSINIHCLQSNSERHSSRLRSRLKRTSPLQPQLLFFPLFLATISVVKVSLVESRTVLVNGVCSLIKFLNKDTFFGYSHRALRSFMEK